MHHGLLSSSRSLCQAGISRICFHPTFSASCSFPLLSFNTNRHGAAPHCYLECTCIWRLCTLCTILTQLQEELIPRLPPSSPTLFEAKKKKNLSFEAIAKHVGRDEVAIAALFYGQAMASAEDIKKLSEILEIDAGMLESQLGGFPNRGSTLDMPPKDPTIYRLYEIVQNYGQAYKAVMHEKFGDGIMSAISFSTKVEKETDDKGEWAKITLRGKWYVC